MTLQTHAALEDVVKELERAMSKFGPFKNPHEGYAVILEELDELWDEVRSRSVQLDGSVDTDSGKIKCQDREAMRKEATQVAAMALRFMIELT